MQHYRLLFLYHVIKNEGLTRRYKVLPLMDKFRAKTVLISTLEFSF